MPPHGTTATAPTDAAPLSNIPQDPQHLRRPEIQDCAGHPGNTNRQLQPNDTDIDQDHQPYLLLEYARIQHGVLVNKIDGGWRCAGMSVTGHTVPTPGLELRVNMLQWVKYVSCKVITNRKQTPIIGKYLPTSTLEHVPDFEDSMKRFQAQYPIVLGEMSVNIDKYQKPCSQQVADLLMDFCLMDLLHHFWQQWLLRHMKT